MDAGYDDVVILENESYDDALIGVTEDNIAVYDFDMMVTWLMEKDGMSELDAVEWIEYNTMRAIPYFGDGAPIIVHRIK